MLKKKALSPLVATILLVVFALIIGTATMSWGKNYEAPTKLEPAAKATISINVDSLNNPLKKLQMEYITGQITLEDYLNKEPVAIENSR